MAEFIRAAISDIHIGDRARPIDEDHAQAIAASMAERGQINPITLRRTPAMNKGKTPLTLVAGGHRLRASSMLGWQEIDAIIVTADQVEAQLIEISENLYRNELSALDRAIFVAKFRELWEDQHGAINPKGGRPKKQGTECPVIFAGGRELSRRVQERFGFGDTTYKKVTRIAQNLHPTLRQAVRGTAAETDQSKLLKLAKLDDDAQLKVAAALRQDPDFNRALAWLKPSKPEADPQEDIFRKVTALLKNADDATLVRLLHHIGDMRDVSFLEGADKLETSSFAKASEDMAA